MSTTSLSRSGRAFNRGGDGVSGWISVKDKFPETLTYLRRKLSRQ